MKIALCKSYFAGPVSGADETLVTAAHALQRAGCDVEVVLLYRCSEDDQYYRRLRDAGVDVSFVVAWSVRFEILKLTRSLLASSVSRKLRLSVSFVVTDTNYSVPFFVSLMARSLRFLRRIWHAVMRRMTQFHYRACLDFLRRARPDVLHVLSPDDGAALLISAGHELGIPVLYHEMGTPHHLPMLEDYYRRLETVLPLCTEVAALSPRLAADWEVRFPFLSSISVLPLIMEQPNEFNISKSRVHPQETIFGFAARLEEGKGPLILLEAIDQLNRKGVRAVTRIAGRGPQSWDVKARARALGLGDACELIGSYSDTLGRAAFMESLHVFVLPSLAEGTPNSVIEAMAHGLPVIATSVGGIPDIVSADCGILIPPGDAKALADAMELLARDPALRAAMGAAAKIRSEKLFSPQTVLPVLLQTYARVTRNGHEAAQTVSETGMQHPWIEPELGAIARA